MFEKLYRSIQIILTLRIRNLCTMIYAYIRSGGISFFFFCKLFFADNPIVLNCMFSNVPIYTGFVVLGLVYIPQDNWVWGKCEVVLPETVHILGALDEGGGSICRMSIVKKAKAPCHLIS